MYNSNNPFESGNSDNNYNPFETDVKKKKQVETHEVQTSQSKARNTNKQTTVKSNSRKPKENSQNQKSKLTQFFWWVIMVLVAYWLS